MQRVIIDIPDNKINFFLELVKNLGFKKVRRIPYEQVEKEYEIPQAHQKLVNERFKKVRKDPERLLDWDQAKEKLKA